MVENITPQLGDYFGVKNGKGVLIRSVEKGSRAEKSGFRAGDVIVRVNDQPVSDTSDFSHAIRSVNSGSVTVGVIREKREQNLTLPLPERKNSGEWIEESFDAPNFDAEAHVDLTKLREEMAQLRPQLQFALQESRKAYEEEVRPEIEKAQREAREEIERAKPEIERALRQAQDATERMRSELCSQERELRQQTQKLQKELERERRRSGRDIRRQMERMRHEMHGDWMQI
jgi:serine protease Do